MARFTRLYSSLQRRWLVVLAGLALVAVAHAESIGSSAAPPAKYQQECAACHIAYPPGFLPAASWQRLMGGLDKHFGTDASLDEPTRRELGNWLSLHAGTYRRVSEEPPQDRVSRSAWFLRKHRDGEVPANVWKRASVGSPSNCAACHAGAAKGNFNEDEVRIPK